MQKANRKSLKPSEEIREVTGKGRPIKDLSPALRSAVRFPIYRLACEILGMPKSERKAAIDGLPENIRDAVRTEAIRVHEYRRKSVASKHNKDYY